MIVTFLYFLVSSSSLTMQHIILTLVKKSKHLIKISDFMKAEKFKELSWGEHTGLGTMNGREESITLHGLYEMRWALYRFVGNTSRGEFRYLMLPVQVFHAKPI